MKKRYGVETVFSFHGVFFVYCAKDAADARNTVCKTCYRLSPQLFAKLDDIGWSYQVTHNNCKAVGKPRECGKGNYSLPVTFTDGCVFYVMAENETEARKVVVNNCGLHAYSNILLRKPTRKIAWNLDDKPQITFDGVWLITDADAALCREKPHERHSH